MKTRASWPPNEGYIHYDLANGVIQINMARAKCTKEQLEIFSKLAKYLPCELQDKAGIKEAKLDSLDFKAMENAGVLVVSLGMSEETKDCHYHEICHVLAHYDNVTNYVHRENRNYSKELSDQNMQDALNNILTCVKEEYEKTGRIKLINPDFLPRGPNFDCDGNQIYVPLYHASQMPPRYYYPK